MWSKLGIKLKNNSNIADVMSGSTLTVKAGDALLVSNSLLEIVEVHANQLILRTKWEQADDELTCSVIPTYGDFNQAVREIRLLRENTANNISALEAWGTQTGTVTFKGEDGEEHTARTLQQMDADVVEIEERANQLFTDISAFGYARSQADMEAERAANKALYAAAGFVHMGKHATVSPAAPVNEGMFSVVGSGWQNKFGLGRNSGEIVGTSETNHAVFHTAGITFDLVGVSDIASTPFVVKLPEAPKGTEVYDSATGTLVNYETAAEAFDAADNEVTKEVVTHPVDLVGFEVFLREINESDPIIYPYGMQQSKLTTVDGIPTVENTFRPITHFEVFKGDETSRGRGWNVLDNSLTDAQLTKIFQTLKHNIFRLSDGRLAQWTLSQRTIRGVGNGDFRYNPATPASTIPLWFDTAGNRCVSVRGALDSVEPFVASNENWYQGWNAADSVKSIPALSHLGAFIPRRSTTNVAVNGESYFYVVATIPRLNQGAYHPSFNPFGTGRIRNLANNAWISWHEDSTLLLNKHSCFDFKTGIGGKPNSKLSGKLGTNSGRPDGRYYDAIYDGGLNGIIDWRTSAWDVGSKEEAAKVTQKVVSGEYRGLEKLMWTVVDVVDTSTAISSSQVPDNIALTDASPRFKYDKTALLGVPYFVVNASTGEVYKQEHPNALDSNRAPSTYFPSSWGTSGNIYVISPMIENISVSGNFAQTDVIGSPEVILKVEALKNGWMGSWLPDFVNANPKVSRKAVVINLLGPRLSTTNLGETWTVTLGISVSETPNTVYRGFSAGAGNGVAVINYQAFAKQTKSSVNKSILNDSDGLGDVWASCDFWVDSSGANGVLLGESLIGKVFTSNSGKRVSNYTLTDFNLQRKKIDNSLWAGGFYPAHTPITLAAPSNNSPAVKVLTYQISNNQQCSLAFAFNELAHNGTDWGDDSTLKIADGTTTYTNLNGDVLLCGTAELAIPYGYTKNKARVGKQTAGVDL
ncbi:MULTISPECIES: hypothetical protein [unclassified Vibrio]|uniref:hypothetical protein n=1 Tax=unclassified Vibrio TaxID=2614977 RepID=UPI00148362FB|nr:MULTISPECIES: hypothetical protein [unclassified Vibrio]NNN44719.1 hypothetical protein [Vibrio sp. 1-1(7)]NNN72092.1 hypothetical protein [Vibrio sp. 12-2(3-a)]